MVPTVEMIYNIDVVHIISTDQLVHKARFLWLGHVVSGRRGNGTLRLRVELPMVQSMEVFEWEKTGPKRGEDFIQKTYEKTLVEKTLVKVAGSPITDGGCKQPNGGCKQPNGGRGSQVYWLVYGFLPKKSEELQGFFELRYIIRKN